MGLIASVALAIRGATLATNAKSVNYNWGTAFVLSAAGLHGRAARLKTGFRASASRLFGSGVMHGNRNGDCRHDHTCNDEGVAGEQIAEGPLAADRQLFG